MHFVYILKCRDGCYYVGLTEDVSKRLAVHNSGKGPSFTASRLPVALVYQESIATLDEAVRREKQLKRWSRAKKEALIQSDLTLLRELSASRTSKRN
jgi:putative endonuclease